MMNNKENTKTTGMTRSGDGVVGTGPPFAYPASIASVSSSKKEKGSGILFAVVDNGQEAIILVDDKTGNRRILSGEGVGKGPAFVAPVNLVYIPSKDDNCQENHADLVGEVIVVDAGLEALVCVDLRSGDRTILSGPQRGTGPLFRDLRDISLDTGTHENSENNKIAVLVSDHSLGAIFNVDYQTGNRIIASSSPNEKGSGPSLKAPCGVTVLPDGDYVASDAGLRSLVRIHRDTGDRSILSGANGDVGQGPLFITPAKIICNNAHSGELIVVDKGHKGLLRVDVATGDRQILTGPDRGTGIKLAIPYGMGFPTNEKTAPNDYLVLCDTVHEAIFEIELSTGNRKILSTARPQDSDRFKFPCSIATSAGTHCGPCCPAVVQNDDEYYIVLDSGAKALVRVDPVTGSRRVISSNDTEGPPLSSPRAIAKMGGRGNNDHFFAVIDIEQHAIYRLHGITGERTVLSGPNKGTGKPLFFPRALMVSSRGRGDVIVADVGSKALIRIDPETGDRTVICDNETRGTGPPVSVVDGIVELEENGNLVVTDTAQRGLLEVNVITGDRTVLFNSEIKRGKKNDDGGPDLKVPFNLIRIGPDKYVVADIGHKGLVEIDLATKESRIVSNPDKGKGPKAITPFGLTRNAKGNYIMVDTARKALIEVCHETGDRVILSE